MLVCKKVALQEISSYLKGFDDMQMCIVKIVSSVLTRVARIKATGEHWDAVFSYASLLVPERWCFALQKLIQVILNS